MIEWMNDCVKFGGVNGRWKKN